jgi:hypothetical protein
LQKTEIQSHWSQHITGRKAQLPAGKIIGKAGNSLLIQLAENKVAVISAPVSDVVFKDNGYPKVDIQWAFE